MCCFDGLNHAAFPEVDVFYITQSTLGHDLSITSVDNVVVNSTKLVLPVAV